MTETGPWGADGQHTDGAHSRPQPDQDAYPWTNPAVPQQYSAPKNRNGLIIGLVVAVVAAVAGAGIVMIVRHNQQASSLTSAATSPVPADHLQSVRIAAPNVITKPGTSEPLAQVKVYEDFLCPYCGLFEQAYGPTLKKLVDARQISVDYTMVSILGQHDRNSYSTRSGAAAYCVADVDKTAFQRFHSALFADQPNETATVFPDNDWLIDQAYQAGATDSVPECVNSGKYLDMVNNAVANANIEGTPTIYLNGVDIGDDLMNKADPQVLIDKVKAITGNAQ
ncbi:protein-disulfide isomerase [Mycobacterium sp. MAA66]|uniref:DsbA family protein n=1 Tax=Mycobacterium sp. MAA66 TaxID=3156297 RepID=UPI003513B030